MKFQMNQMPSNVIVLGLALLAIGACEAFICPSHCSCTELQPDHHIHAKCASLEGLRQLGKTSELYSLDLSSLNLTKITNQLEKFTSLSKLDLHNNHLSEINSLSLKRIRTLNLSWNRITSGKLSNFPAHIKHLNLSHNDITILTENFKLFVNLESFELADNPLNCTCETLDIRDWLQEKKVWTNTPILCTAPLNYKGRPWLQVPQSEVCDSNDLDSPRMLPYSKDENDLMMGDDPSALLNDATIKLNINIEDEFLPVSENSLRHKRQDVSEEDEENISNQSDHEEGSGADETESSTIKIENDVYEGSGDNNDTTVYRTRPTTQTESSGTSHSIFDHSNKESTEPSVTELPEKIDEPIENEGPKPVERLHNIIMESNQNIMTKPEEVEKSKKVESIDPEASNSPYKADSNGTYILLAILGIILVLLILYVAAKRYRSTAVKNRRSNNDVERPAQEMLAMDKKNLGKPVPNQVEFIPLIPEKHATDKKTNLANAEEPLLQKLSEAENENDQSSDSLKVTNEPQTATKQMNGNAKPLQNGLHDEKVNCNGNGDEYKKFPSISPKPSRYSPVSEIDDN